MELSERVERWEKDYPHPLDDEYLGTYDGFPNGTVGDTVKLLRDLIADWKRLRQELDDTRKAYEELHRMGM